MKERERILAKIEETGIIPVVVLKNAKDAKPLGKALIKGGLPCAEVTFRTEAAEESIRILSESFKEMLVGAGTILTIEQAEKAVAAGAKFIVSPGLNPRVVKYCVSHGILIIPGCCNPSDIEQALENGITTVKFFPAEAAGGLPMIKAMSAPYANVRFMPTGGIHMGNVTSYLSFPSILACGGSWMVKEEFLEKQEFHKIEKMAKEASEFVKQCRGGKGL